MQSYQFSASRKLEWPEVALGRCSEKRRPEGTVQGKEDPQKHVTEFSGAKFPFVEKDHSPIDVAEAVRFISEDEA